MNFWHCLMASAVMSYRRQKGESVEFRGIYPADGVKKILGTTLQLFLRARRATRKKRFV